MATPTVSQILKKNKNKNKKQSEHICTIASDFKTWFSVYDTARTAAQSSKSSQQPFQFTYYRGGLGSQTSRGKNIKAALLTFFPSFFFMSNRPCAAQNQAAHVAIAKTPQRPVRLCLLYIHSHIQTLYSTNLTIRLR